MPSEAKVFVVTVSDGRSTWVDSVWGTLESAQAHIKQEREIDAEMGDEFTYRARAWTVQGETNAE